jgi:hypothetical protein
MSLKLPASSSQGCLLHCSENFLNFTFDSLTLANRGAQFLIRPGSGRSLIINYKLRELGYCSHESNMALLVSRNRYVRIMSPCSRATRQPRLPLRIRGPRSMKFPSFLVRIAAGLNGHSAEFCINTFSLYIIDSRAFARVFCYPHSGVTSRRSF